MRAQASVVTLLVALLYGPFFAVRKQEIQLPGLLEVSKLSSHLFCLRKPASTERKSTFLPPISCDRERVTCQEKEWMDGIITQLQSGV